MTCRPCVTPKELQNAVVNTGNARGYGHYISTLGCSKNDVDASGMSQLLGEAGSPQVASPENADVLIVNTCGFINSAKEQSVAELLRLAALKADGQYLIAAGCMAQRYSAELVAAVPGLDGVIGTRRWMDIVRFVQSLRQRKDPAPLYHVPTDADRVGRDDRGVQRAFGEKVSAYVKIADGCRRPCAFCAIPLIKGTAVSRPVEAIVRDIKKLHSAGLQEAIIVAQDSTDYGQDIGLKNGLAELLTAIVREVPTLPWIRLMYAYPGAVSDRLIETMAEHRQILNYLDIPLQHGSAATLRRMRRPANIQWCYRTLDKLRNAMPDIAIRTTMIVGYPGETDAEFAELLQFVRDLKFDRLGAFTYSLEENTPSFDLPDRVGDDVASERFAALMEAQQAISLAKNQALVGSTMMVLPESTRDGFTLSRSFRDAPEVDGYVLVEGSLELGVLTPVRITGAMTHDLVASAPRSTLGPLPVLGS
jgi:ribosomal protein S12 methylthiotransferase